MPRTQLKPKSRGKNVHEGTTKKAKAKTGAIAEVPILNHDDLDSKTYAVALANWLLALQMYVRREYLEFKFVFDELDPRYLNMPMVDVSDLYRPPTNEELDAHEGPDPPTHVRVYKDDLIDNKIVKRRIVTRERVAEKIRDNRMVVYALAWGQLGKSIRDLMRSGEGFDASDNERSDPLRLVSMIRSTHKTERMATDPVVILHETKTAFNRTYQEKGKRSAGFKRRFFAAYKTWREAGGPPHDERYLAHKFVERLLRSTYGEQHKYFKARIIGPFENVEAAHRHFREHESVQASKNDPVDTSEVYAVEGSSKNKNKNKRSVYCRKCKKEGHRTNECVIKEHQKKIDQLMTMIEALNKKFDVHTTKHEGMAAVIEQDSQQIEGSSSRGEDTTSESDSDVY